MQICDCNVACSDCDRPSPSCQAHLDQGLDLSTCCACSNLRPNNEHLCPDECKDAEACRDLLNCPGICDQTDPRLFAIVEQLVGVTMQDVAAFVELVDCIGDSPVESCVAPLESGTWELGECQGPVIAQAKPMVDLREDPEYRCGSASDRSVVQHCGWCAAPSWNCYGWYDETNGECHGEDIAVDVPRSDGTIERQYVYAQGCYPPDWQMAMHPMGWWSEFCPPDWILTDLGCAPDEIEMEPGSEPVLPDPWIQPHPLYENGLSKEECLEFCNTHKAGCCSTDDGRQEVNGGTLELVQAPWGCIAHELKWHHDSDEEAVQYEYQDPRREEWDRITVTKVKPQVDSSIITPEIAKQMTCEALCDNDMSCGGWNLDPYEQINCARYELRPGLTSQERCLARQEHPEMCRVQGEYDDDCFAEETSASCAQGFVMVMSAECEVDDYGNNVCAYKCVDSTEICEWNEGDGLCEPKRECGTQCKMWYVTQLSFCPRACERC